MARFENTITTIHAYVIDIENMTKNEVEYVSETYTRSEKKAEEIIREALDIEESALVKIFKLEQSNEKPTEYNIGKMLHDGYGWAVTDEELEENEIAIPITLYKYYANVYFEDIDGDNPTAQKYITDATHRKLTKGSARDYIKMCVETEYTDVKCVMVTHNTRKEGEAFIIIDKEDAKNYEL